MDAIEPNAASGDPLLAARDAKLAQRRANSQAAKMMLRVWLGLGVCNLVIYLAVSGHLVSSNLGRPAFDCLALIQFVCAFVAVVFSLMGLDLLLALISIVVGVTTVSVGAFASFAMHG